jgi:hypothetical protein
MSLALSISTLGGRADAGLVDSNAIGIRAVTGLDYSTDGPMVVLLDSGQLLRIHGTEITTLQDVLPVPAGEVLVFEAKPINECNVDYLGGPAYVITQAGILYYKANCSYNWINLGPLPGTGPISTKQSTWGVIKDKFRSK